MQTYAIGPARETYESASQVELECPECSHTVFHLHCKKVASVDEEFLIYCANDECGQEYTHLRAINPNDPFTEVQH